MRLSTKLAASIMYLLFTSFLTGTSFAHDAAPDWIRDLRNGENGKCCGEDDCTPISSIHVLETRGDIISSRSGVPISPYIRKGQSAGS